MELSRCIPSIVLPFREPFLDSMTNFLLARENCKCGQVSEADSYSFCQSNVGLLGGLPALWDSLHQTLQRVGFLNLFYLRSMVHALILYTCTWSSGRTTAVYSTIFLVYNQYFILISISLFLRVYRSVQVRGGPPPRRPSSHSCVARSWRTENRRHWRLPYGRAEPED
jgi:hypothetical protein